MKKILLIATGGTIACGATDSGLTPMTSARELLEQLSNGTLPPHRTLSAEQYEVRAIQPFSLDSTNMSPREWIRLAQIIRDSYAEYDGFVIAHGTDTMSYAAAALFCLVQNSAKPIVLTGSQLPMLAPETDVGRNLRDAFLCALDGRVRGVCVVFGGRIIDGRCAVKLHTTELDAFRSVNRPDIGSVDEEGVVSLAEEGASGGEPAFYDRMDESVLTVRLTPGAAFPSVRRAKAVIIEGFGMGGLPDYGDAAMEQEVLRLCGSGAYVIMATQVLYGGTNLSVYRVGREAAEHCRLIEAGTKTVEYAAMRAMWALAYSDNRDEFERLFG